MLQSPCESVHAFANNNEQRYPQAEGAEDGKPTVGTGGQGVRVELSVEFRQRESTLAVVFLTGHGDVPMAVEQMKLGAVDFLQKPVSARPLQTALERALVVSEQAVARQQIATCYRGLTAKERELAGFVVKGLMNREIAQVMNIAVRTVEVHRARVMEKMQAANLAELVNKWQQLKETRIVE